MIQDLQVLWQKLKRKEHILMRKESLTIVEESECGDDAHENTNDDTSEKDKNKASENTVKFTAGGSPRGGRCVLKVREWLWRNV